MDVVAKRLRSKRGQGGDAPVQIGGNERKGRLKGTPSSPGEHQNENQCEWEGRRSERKK